MPFSFPYLKFFVMTGGKPKINQKLKKKKEFFFLFQCHAECSFINNGMLVKLLFVPLDKAKLTNSKYLKCVSLKRVLVNTKNNLSEN